MSASCILNLCFSDYWLRLPYSMARCSCMIACFRRMMEPFWSGFLSGGLVGGMLGRVATSALWKLFLEEPLVALKTRLWRRLIRRRAQPDLGKILRQLKYVCGPNDSTKRFMRIIGV